MSTVTEASNPADFKFDFSKVNLDIAIVGDDPAQQSKDAAKVEKAEALVYNFKLWIKNQSINISAIALRQEAANDKQLRAFIEKFDLLYSDFITRDQILPGCDATPEEIALAKEGMAAAKTARLARKERDDKLRAQYEAAIDISQRDYLNSIKGLNTYAIIAQLSISNVPMSLKYQTFSIEDQTSRLKSSDEVLTNFRKELLAYARANKNSLDVSRIVF